MIQLYTNIKYLSSSMEVVHLNDNFFNLNADDAKFDQMCFNYMDIIDNAEYNGNGYMTTPFGRTKIIYLSTGCKTLINIVQNPDKIFNIAECGDNALEEVFKMDGITVFMKYCRLPQKIIHSMEINGKDIVLDKKELLKWWYQYEDDK